MDVLVVGGTRFVGYQLVWRLLAGGHRVTILNRGTRPDPFGDAVERLRADRTTAAFDAAVSGRRFDAVVDFAVYTAQDAHGAVRALRDRTKHYVFISTGQVYLVRQDCPVPSREADFAGPLQPQPTAAVDLENWRYGIDKRAAEDVFAAAFVERAFPYTSLRLPMVNGERDHYRRLESYLWRLLDGGPILLPDGTDPPTRHVYSGAVVRCIANLLGQEATHGQSYNLAQDETVPLTTLVTTLAEVIGARPDFVSVAAPALRAAGLDPVQVSLFHDPWMSRLDPARARTDLGFTHDPLRPYLDRIATTLLSNPPTDRPPSYAHRPSELRLAQSL